MTLRLYTGKDDEARLDRIYAEGLRLPEARNPSRNPKWWGLRLALGVSLAQRTRPDLYRRSSTGAEYQLMQVSGEGKSGDVDPDLTDAFRALLSIYHGEDLFAGMSADDGGKADRRFLELLYCHIHRGLEILDAAVREGHPLERFLADVLFASVERRPSVDTDALMSRLLEAGIRAELEESRRGPRVDLLYLRLNQPDALGRLRSAADDLAFALGLPEKQILVLPSGVPMVATLAVPRRPEDWDTYDDRHLESWIQDASGDFRLPIWLGARLDGTPFCFDLTECPHLLVAGTTGSGKSMCMHAILLSLALIQGPSDIRLVIIDPKQGMEFGAYKNLPHLKSAQIVPSASAASEAFASLLLELHERQRRLGELGLNQVQDARLDFPRIVLVVDELAELVLEDRELEQSLIRLAQLGRAAGIHLVLATQRPDAETFSGLLRSNVPSRIALKVAKASDSLIILDEPGAERLLGKGDMLVRVLDQPPARVQGLYLPLDAVRRLLDRHGRRHE